MPQVFCALFSEKNYFLNKWRVFLPFLGMKKDCCIRF